MVTVLCMTGWCRNGSTIIGNILNEIPSFMHVGELHFQWKKAVGQGVNNLCGCGMVLTDCPFWSAALTTTIPHGAALGDFAAEVVRRQRAGVRTRHTWRLLQHGADRADVRAHAALTTLSYAEIAARSGARVIWIPRRSPVRPRCCRTWTESDPAGTIDRLVRPCGMDPAANPVRGRTVDLHANHTVTGNPDRFLTGPTVLRNADDRWRASLSGRARLAATLLSWPLSLRYGYTGRGPAVRPTAPALAERSR